MNFSNTAPKGHFPCSVYGMKPFKLTSIPVENSRVFIYKALFQRLKPQPKSIEPLTKKESQQISQTASTLTQALEKPLHIFISYACEDEDLKTQLCKHLSVLERQGEITIWHNQYIQAGTSREQEIYTRIQKAHIVLLLGTANYVASNDTYDKELQLTMKFYQSGTVRKVIPIILEPADFEGTLFETPQTLPKNRIPVTLWHNKEEAFAHIVKEIRRIVRGLSL